MRASGGAGWTLVPVQNRERRPKLSRRRAASVMTQIPNFATVDFADAPSSASAAAAAPWLTPEGIAVKPAYRPDDLAGLDFLDTFPGVAPYLRGPYPTMYVTQPWTV